MRRTHLFTAHALFASLFCATAFGQAQDAKTPLYQNAHAPLETRVQDLFGRLTPDEKLSLLTGTAFTTQPLPRLGVRAMGMADAGQGVRGGMDSTLGPATLFPAGVTMASTWDPTLIGHVGQAIGEEALNKGTGAQVLLGPAVNIQRSPLGGRNGEYFSEDPYLAAQLGVGYIQGMQGAGCGACLKHFACNNEEVDRGFVNVKVDERTLREIYLPAFEAGVKDGHVWTVMSSYNKVNGHHSSANEYLLTEVLKKGWGFDGMVMSDWGGVHETVGVVNAGNDLEMPGPGQLAPTKVAKALAQGRITQAQIDDNVRRILRTVLRTGMADPPHTPDHAVINSPEHRQVALDAASQGIVLLKNSGSVLPLDASKIKSLAVIGPAAKGMQFGAAGSPGLQPFSSVDPLDGLTKRAGAGVAVRYARGTSDGVLVPSSVLVPGPGGGNGLKAEYFANRNLAGEPTFVRTDTQISFDWNETPAPGIAHNDFSVRWTGMLTPPVTGRYTLSLTSDDGCRLFLNGKPLIDQWYESGANAHTADVDLVAGHAYALRVEYFQGGGLAVARLAWTPPGMPRFTDAVEAARHSDAAIVCVTTSGTEGEGSDRPSMALPNDQDALIQAVAAVNKKTIVVLNNGTPVEMTRWLSQVPGVIEAWFPGEEGGTALASIIFGDVSPSGKLPTTLGVKREDYPDYGHFPGVLGQVEYAEGIYVGYRHFDKKNIAPLFPFGYGLSYTTFRYGPVRLSQSALNDGGPVSVQVPVTNTGRRTGAEVVEMYVHDPHPQIDKPVRELKGFQKVTLKPGETKMVTLTLSPRALAYCDVPGKQWKADAGVYTVEIGASSRDIRQTSAVTLPRTWTEPIPFLGESLPTHDLKDLALGRPVTASSTEKRDDIRPEYAVDGDEGTRWGSEFSDPQWIAVDLGKPTVVDHVRLTWEDTYATAYAVQVSGDGKTWTDVFSTQNGQGGVETARFAPVTARWVRMYGTKRATKFGASLFSFEVFAPDTGPAAK